MEWLTNIDLNILFWIERNLLSVSLDPFMIALSKIGNLGIIWIVIGIVLVSLKNIAGLGFQYYWPCYSV